MAWISASDDATAVNAYGGVAPFSRGLLSPLYFLPLRANDGDRLRKVPEIRLRPRVGQKAFLVAYFFAGPCLDSRLLWRGYPANDRADII